MNSKFIKIGFFGVFVMILIYFYFGSNNKRVPTKVISMLSKAYKLESACSSKEPLEFPIEAFDNVDVDADCVKNTIEFAAIRGIDLDRISPEKNCKCLKLNLDKVLEKHASEEDQCLLVQAKNFIERRCRELAVK